MSKVKTAKKAIEAAATEISDCVCDGCPAINAVTAVVRALDAAGWQCVPKKVDAAMAGPFFGFQYVAYFDAEDRDLTIAQAQGRHDALLAAAPRLVKP